MALTLYILRNCGYSFSEYVMLIALRVQQWLRERALVLGYMYIVCLVK